MYIAIEAIESAAPQQSPRLEREAAIQECAEVADRLSDCSAAFIADQIRDLLSPDSTVVSSTDPLCPDCGRSLNGPTHATYCMVPSKDRADGR